MTLYLMCCQGYIKCPGMSKVNIEFLVLFYHMLTVNRLVTYIGKRKTIVFSKVMWNKQVKFFFYLKENNILHSYCSSTHKKMHMFENSSKEGEALRCKIGPTLY